MQCSSCLQKALFLLAVLLHKPLCSDIPYHRIRELELTPQQEEIEAKERTSLTGDWNGARQMLKEKGVDISASYTNDLLGNPVGGKRKGFYNAGNFGIDLSFDLDKIAKAKGLSFFTSFVDRSGSNLSKKRIDNEFPVQQEYGSETYRLNELYLKQTLFHDRVMLKAGRVNAANHFLQSPLYYEYVTNAIDGNPISIFFNTPMSVYPVATWGAYFEAKPHRSFLFRIGVYNNNKNVFKNKYHGAYFSFKSTEGAMIMTEWVYLANQGANDHWLPGNYKFGWYYVTGDVAKFEGGDQKGNFGYYFLIDQMIYRKKEEETYREIIPFAAFLFAPKDRNKFPFFMTAGIVCKGIIPDRPNDATCLGAAYGAYSSDLRKVQRASRTSGIIGPFGNKPETSETNLELNHWVQVSNWLAITPAIQYIINPKGFGTIQNALVMGMQVSIDL